MTKERLEELIKKNGTVYFGTYNEDDIFTFLEIKLKHCYILDNELHDEQEGCYYDFVDLFETKEQAEWHCKVDAERPERFEPPMWEEIEEHFDCIDYKFAFVKNNEVYSFTVRKNGAIDISKWFIYNLGFHPIYTADATKENYEKACEIVRDLFDKEESNGKEVK